MAVLEYKNSLSRYRKYLQVVQSRPLFRASLYLVFSLGLLIVLVAAALRPTLITISSLIGQIQQQRELETKLVHKINLIKMAQQELSALSDQLPLLDESLPKKAQLEAWAQALENIASQSGLAVTTVTVTDIPTDSPLPTTSLEYQIGADGQYAQIYNFIEVLHNHRRLITPSTINISRAGGEVEMLQLSLTGQIGAYREKNEN